MDKKFISEKIHELFKSTDFRRNPIDKEVM